MERISVEMENSFHTITRPVRFDTVEPPVTGNHTVSTKNTRRNGIITDPSARAG